MGEGGRLSPLHCPQALLSWGGGPPWMPGGLLESPSPPNSG